MPRTYEARRDDSTHRTGWYVNEYTKDEQGTTRRETLYDCLSEEKANRIVELLEALNVYDDWRAIAKATA